MNTLFSAVVCVAVISAPSDTDLKEWQARYAKVDKLYAAKNTKELAAYLTDDFVYVTKEGKKLDRKTVVSGYADMVKVKKITCVQKVQKIVANGSNIDVTFDSTVTLDNGSGQKFALHSVAVDSWKKVKGEWKNYKTVEKSADQKVVK